MKNQKAKRRIGIISMMLVLLLSIGAVAGTTLAKYVSSTEKTAQATVAKWGVTFTVTDELFGDAYTDGAITTYQTNVTTVDVQAATQNALLVAPGTKGGYLKLALGGAPEVASQLTLTFEVKEVPYLQFEVEELVDGSDEETETVTYYYYPINWYVGADKELVEVEDVENNISTMEPADYLEALNEAIADELTEQQLAVKQFRPNTALTTYNNSLITWDWAFEAEENADTINGYDTILGDLAASADFYKDSASSVIYGEADGQLNYNLGVKVYFKAIMEQIQNDDFTA